MAERPPFDPSHVRVPESERLFPLEIPKTLTPRAVNELVRGALARHLPAVLHVLGEVADMSQPTSGHLYFALKDASSELRCVMWRSSAARLKFSLDPGMEVIATGGLDVYTPRGTYQLIVSKIEPRGVGALELAFRQLKERLQAEGLFDPARKKPLPKIPRRIALVTSPTGAAIRDIVQTLARRFPPAEILVFPVKVQGEGAAKEIAHAVREVSRCADAVGGIDVAIVGRGGGSLEDLWAFNEESVARAIAASVVPIVSAVGHEVDVSISDLVADVRAATPTAAAELVAPHRADLMETADRHVARVLSMMKRSLELAKTRLAALLAYDRLARPVTMLREQSQLLDEREQRLLAALRERARRARAALNESEIAMLRFATGARFARLSQRLDHRVFAAGQAVQATLVRAERRANASASRLHRALPSNRLARYDEHLNQVQNRFLSALRRLRAHQYQQLAARVERIAACHPKRVLLRGYSLTREARTRRIIRSIQEIREGTRVVTELADGEFRSTADDPNQPRLFE